MRIRLLLITSLLVSGLLWLSACSTSTDLGGVGLPNARPDTRITGQPPTLLEAGFVVGFNWIGTDPDGRIIGYQWKVSDNGHDGISPRDTLTIDPATGAELNPWHFTTSTDSLLMVLADQADFPGDLEQPGREPRSYRTHTLFVRAMDDDRSVDPTPAHLTFTSTTFVPTVDIIAPYSGGNRAKEAPPTVTVAYTGHDEDRDTHLPDKFRFLWKKAEYIDALGDLNYVRLEYYYEEEMIDFDDPTWSIWYDYPDNVGDRQISFPNQLRDDEYGNRIGYFLALQVKDIAGAVSIGRAYNHQVGNFEIDRKIPDVTLFEVFLGATGTDKRHTIAAGQPLNFQWIGDASSYLGEIVSYRYGWDVLNVDDPNDEAWSPPGTSAQHRIAPERSFTEGFHTFVLRVEDNSQQVKIIRVELEVVPFVLREFQLPLLVLDQIRDEGWESWPSQDGSVYYDEQAHRNGFWRETLAEGSGSVEGFTWEENYRPDYANVSYADIVDYKALLIYTKSRTPAPMMNGFRPHGYSEDFVWLAPYQEQGGNLFFVGSAGLFGFLNQDYQFWAPVVFSTSEGAVQEGFGYYHAGFGEQETPDGEVIAKGPLQYPAKVAGLSLMDWTGSQLQFFYGTEDRIYQHRSSRCTGLKGLRLDEDFRANHLIGAGTMSDVVMTDAQIDWYDEANWDSDVLLATYSWSLDEFYDSNIANRPTPYQLQLCDNGPGGYCVEPMYRGIARFDWIRDKRWSDGEADWPSSRYGANGVEGICGDMGLTFYEGEPQMSSRTDGQTFGFLSYKNTLLKPNHKADVYWGFDPHRFDKTETKKAIRWVMQYFGLTLN